MLKKSRWIFIPLLIVGFSLIFNNASQAAELKACRSITGFVMLVDLSQSRTETFLQQKELEKRFLDVLPNLDYQAAIRTFWQPFNPLPGETTSQLVYGPARMDKAAMQAVLAGQQYHKAITPLGPAMNAAAADLAKMPGRNALIIFSDFEESDRFGNPVAEAKALKAKFPDLCIVAIHYQTKELAAILAKEVAAASGCGKFYEGPKLMNDNAALEAMVREVFTQSCPDPVVISLHLEFDFDKSDIRPQYHNDIKKAADYLIANPTTVAVVEGHTDNKGSDQYNEKLSFRRADSLMKYLVEKFGIDARRLTAKGYGESKPVADNNTDAGRQLNRRVDVVISGK